MRGPVFTSGKHRSIPQAAAFFDSDVVQPSGLPEHGVLKVRTTRKASWE
jgi:hypothetical protein